MVKDKFLVLVVEELIDELHAARFFAKLDLRVGYQQVCVHPDDIEKTVFLTHHKHFEFLVMPWHYEFLVMLLSLTKPQRHSKA
jgi:hypothetical protein